ncbi:type VI secretion system lipoprotein TssJ [Rhodoferax sp.]|uniref:type VI secretion system lipoprotein TssJ n=1 Tax=Rhodoferax sp. TaxID=50421 RepID=UPI00274BB9F5|nr:type VI secretion system lipoprotein TssJ [Rhodoferax sp.]
MYAFSLVREVTSRWLGRSLWQGLAAAGLVLAAVSLTGCASKPVVSQIKLSLAAGSDVNPDARNRPSPITVRVYALKSAAAFEAADFFSLFEKDAAILGADLVQREELLMRPGDSKPLEMKLPPEAKALAVFAAFRDLDRARWRAVRVIEVGKEASLQIKVVARQITIE